MSAFQWLLVAFCAVQVLLGLRRFRRTRERFHLAFGFVWLVGAILFLNPAMSSWLAKAMGIGRGVDLVFYILCVVFVWAHYQHYLRYKRVEDHVTTLVRELAIRDAYASGSSPVPFEKEPTP